MFSMKTSNTMLRGHLESKHTLLYLTKLLEEHWQPQSPLIKAAITSGYTIGTLIQALSPPDISFDNLPPPPPREEDDEVLAGFGPQSNADLGSGIPEFSLKAFHEYLVNFIVANDQVMNIFQSA
jgi:hypothetical protein